VRCSVLQVSSVQQITPQRVAVCCSALQCVAVCCSVLQWVAVCKIVLQCAAVGCRVLQCVAVCYNVLQCVVKCCIIFFSGNIFQGPTCCSVLQCGALCCTCKKHGGMVMYASSRPSEMACEYIRSSQSLVLANECRALHDTYT